MFYVPSPIDPVLHRSFGDHQLRVLVDEAADLPPQRRRRARSEAVRHRVKETRAVPGLRHHTRPPQDEIAPRCPHLGPLALLRVAVFVPLLFEVWTTGRLVLPVASIAAQLPATPA
eukprot:CAMPEP_0119478564 /NCGR_PEP_ID=MMETSP1344-20130328/8244_1 /TAXON_ID=236787 /ORGANISM="Florenciella parvula, Strain CCMP2471" /LENGTH=115 /DNA_ID=CAMNT_0007512743 /DNA_START=265 /DNA_END=609 /DNA_ORIENTATION=-